jgi:hypothetical protein
LIGANDNEVWQMIHWPSMRQAAPGGGSGISVLGSTDASAEVSAGSWSAVSGETALVAESHAVIPAMKARYLANYRAVHPVFVKWRILGLRGNVHLRASHLETRKIPLKRLRHRFGGVRVFPRTAAR